jgi:hypothetical protein
MYYILTQFLETSEMTDKISLPAIVGAISRSLDAYEDGQFDESALAEVLGDLSVDLRSAVDRRIGFLDHLGKRSAGGKPGTGLIGRYEELYREYRAAAERAEALKARVEESTMLVMQTLPDVKFQGNLGRLACQNNSAGRLEVDFPLGSRTFSNLLEFSGGEETMESSAVNLIPEEYIKRIFVKQLDTAKLKADIEAGKEIVWARVEKGQHLRVRR